MKVDIMVTHGSTLYYPPVQEGVTVDWERKGTPGKLTFNIARDEQMKLAEGDSVRMQVDGKDFFFGYVFTKKHSKGDTVAVTVFDQLRYFKNKDTYVYSNKTADGLVRMIASDFLLQTGQLDGTGWVIKHRIEDNVTLFDIVGNALDDTLMNTKKMFVLRDECGRLTLRDVESLKLPLLIDGSTVEDFDYTSSIDSNTYNQVKVVHEDTERGERGVYIAKDSANIQKWGVLQLTDTVETAATGKQKADTLLALYNRVSRTLSLQNVLGDTRVREGASLVCMLDLGDVVLQNYMLVEGAKHKFTQNQHLMDLRLRGGVITG